MQYRRYGKVLNRTKFDPNEIILESDMAKIVLYNKNGDKIAEALIDTEDIGKISSDKWCIDKNNYVKNSKQEYLHRVILGAPKDMCVDHINGNTLDNRKNNLRICTNRENTSNRTKLGTNNTSGILGVRFDDRATGNVKEFCPNAKIIHVDIDPAAISKNISVDIPIVADAKIAIEAILKKAKKLNIDEWRNQISEWKETHPIKMEESEDILTPEYIIRKINKLYKNAIITTDVGQNQLWTTQFIDIDNNKRLLTSGGLGTMGYGLPSAIGAKIACPDKDVISISGDGGIQMNIQELATAVCQELPITVCIFNNGYLGNVRQWQEMFYNKRYSSTCLKYRKSCDKNCKDKSKCCPEYTPNFIKLAESYGCQAIRVSSKEEVEKAFKQAKKNKKSPTIIEFIIDDRLNVLPMVPPGNPLQDMILKKEEE